MTRNNKNAFDESIENNIKSKYENKYKNVKYHNYKATKTTKKHFYIYIFIIIISLILIVGSIMFLVQFNKKNNNMKNAKLNQNNNMTGNINKSVENNKEKDNENKINEENQNKDRDGYVPKYENIFGTDKRQKETENYEYNKNLQEEIDNIYASGKKVAFLTYDDGPREGI